MGLVPQELVLTSTPSRQAGRSDTVEMSAASPSPSLLCWCGSSTLASSQPEIRICGTCGTLVRSRNLKVAAADPAGAEGSIDGCDPTIGPQLNLAVLRS